MATIIEIRKKIKLHIFLNMLKKYKRGMVVKLMQCLKNLESKSNTTNMELTRGMDIVECVIAVDQKDRWEMNLHYNQYY